MVQRIGRTNVSDIVKRLRNPIRIKTDYGLELDRREAADRIEQLEALLREATAELQWWIDNHMCCYGHQGDLMTRLRDADMQKSSVSDRETADEAPDGNA